MWSTTGIQPGDASPTIVENYIEKITCYDCPNAPPGESTSKHLNGISFNGGQTSALVLRNHVVLASPDDAGRIINQTDALAFFQDSGDFPGTRVADPLVPSRRRLGENLREVSSMVAHAHVLVSRTSTWLTE